MKIPVRGDPLSLRRLLEGSCWSVRQLCTVSGRDVDTATSTADEERKGHFVTGRDPGSLGSVRADVCGFGHSFARPCGVLRRQRLHPRPASCHSDDILCKGAASCVRAASTGTRQDHDMPQEAPPAPGFRGVRPPRPAELALRPSIGRASALSRAPRRVLLPLPWQAHGAVSSAKGVCLLAQGESPLAGELLVFQECKAPFLQVLL